MNVEERLKELILANYKSIRAFTVAAGIPYSTVDNIFKRGIGGTAVTTVVTPFSPPPRLPCWTTSTS